MSELKENIDWYRRVWPFERYKTDFLVSQIEFDFLINKKSGCSERELNLLSYEIEQYKKERGALLVDYTKSRIAFEESENGKRLNSLLKFIQESNRIEKQNY